MADRSVELYYMGIPGDLYYKGTRETEDMGEDKTPISYSGSGVVYLHAFLCA